MTLAEQITFSLLRSLGYREPKRFSRWTELVELAQVKINEHLDVMVRIAKDEAKR